MAETYDRVLQDMSESFMTVVCCWCDRGVQGGCRGLDQGSALSPFLFAMVRDKLMDEVGQESPWTVTFADEVVICGESREQVEENTCI